MSQTVAVSVSFFTQLPIILEKREFAMLWANLVCHLGKIVLRPQNQPGLPTVNTQAGEIFQKFFPNLNF